MPRSLTAPYTEELTSREREVIALIAEGHTNGEIAEELGISFLTARNHVANILGKLGVGSRAEAADWWREHELAPVRERRWVHSLRGLLKIPLPSAGAALKIAGGATTVAVAGTTAFAAAVLAGSMLNRDDSPAADEPEPVGTETPAESGPPANELLVIARPAGGQGEVPLDEFGRLASCLAADGAALNGPWRGEGGSAVLSLDQGDSGEPWASRIERCPMTSGMLVSAYDVGGEGAPGGGQPVDRGLREALASGSFDATETAVLQAYAACLAATGEVQYGSSEAAWSAALDLARAGEPGGNPGAPPSPCALLYGLAPLNQ